MTRGRRPSPREWLRYRLAQLRRRIDMSSVVGWLLVCLAFTTVVVLFFEEYNEDRHQECVNRNFAQLSRAYSERVAAANTDRDANRALLEALFERATTADERRAAYAAWKTELAQADGERDRATDPPGSTTC